MESVFNKTTEQPRNDFLRNTDSTDYTDVRKAFLSISIREIRGIRVQKNYAARITTESPWSLNPHFTIQNSQRNNRLYPTSNPQIAELKSTYDGIRIHK